jgi:LAO/AO transport system kinase
MAASGCDVILIETVGVGQSEMDIVRLADITLMVLAPGFGDDIQAMKAGLLEVADFLVVNKYDLPGADALRMEMQQIFADKEETSQIPRVLQTIASEHTGIVELIDSIYSFGEYLETNNIKIKRRNKALDSETLDWIFEILRPRFTEQLKTDSNTQQTDPRIRAQQLIANTLNG